MTCVCWCCWLSFGLCAVLLDTLTHSESILHSDWCVSHSFHTRRRITSRAGLYGRGKDTIATVAEVRLLGNQWEQRYWYIPCQYQMQNTWLIHLPSTALGRHQSFSSLFLSPYSHEVEFSLRIQAQFQAQILSLFINCMCWCIIRVLFKTWIRCSRSCLKKMNRVAVGGSSQLVAVSWV